MPELHVARGTLSDALGQLERAAGRRRELTLRISFRDGELTLALPGAEVVLPAAGTWPGTAHVPWTPLAVLGRRLPPGDPLRLAVEDGRFSMATLALAARWEDISPPPIPTPVNLSPLLALQLAARFTEAELATSGLQGLVEQARELLERRLRSAHDELHEFGVTTADLEELADACIRRGAATSLPPPSEPV